MILPVHKALYVRVMKTGSTSLLKTFRHNKVPIKRLVTRHVVSKDVLRDLNHPHMDHIRLAAGDEMFNSYFKFGFVRNPWDYTVSRWKMSQSYPKSSSYKVPFKEWVCTWETNGGLQQLSEITKGCDWVGRFENLQHDFDILCNLLNIPSCKLFMTNRSGRRKIHYTEYYDDMVTSIVENHFSDDIKMYGYIFGA